MLISARNGQSRANVRGYEETEVLIALFGVVIQPQYVHVINFFIFSRDTRVFLIDASQPFQAGLAPTGAV